MNFKACRETAILLAEAARECIEAAWHGEAGTVLKDDGSPVTPADYEIEDRLRHIIAARHPDHSVLGEEYGHDRRSSALTWVIDPIDGTRQFAARLMNFGVLVSLCADDVPILGMIDQPLAKLRCIALKGEGTRLNGRRVSCRPDAGLDRCVISLANPRSFTAGTRSVFEALSERGSMAVYDGGCIAYMGLASGAIDICLNGPDLDPFDICALVPIVEEAGGRITGWHGETLTMHSRGAIVATGSATLHREVESIIDAALSGDLRS